MKGVLFKKAKLLKLKQNRLLVVGILPAQPIKYHGPGPLNKVLFFLYILLLIHSC